MTTTLNAPPPQAVSPPRLDHFLMHDAPWNLYQSFIEETGNRNLRITYCDGSMEIMSPLFKHEGAKKLFAQLVELLTRERRIPRVCGGSLTLSSELLEKGLEPDECYYLANAPRIRGKERINLAVDPPPDLVLEMDISYRAINRELIYAAMKVPEVWRYDGQNLECLVLKKNGEYQASERSLVFPFLPVSELTRFVEMAAEKDELVMGDAFLDWLKTLPKS